MKNNEIDKHIESIQANGGLSDKALEKDYEASQIEKPDYFDSEGNPHYFDEEDDDESIELTDEELEQMRQSEMNNNELTEEDLELCKQVIPTAQFEFTRELCNGEDGEFFKGKLKEVADICRKITTDEDLYNEDMTHDIGFRYFLGSTEIYCTQLYPDTNNPSKTDGYGFGYVILNGDLQMSEWGDIPINEIKNIDFMEMDYHIPEGKTVEKYLFERHPDYFDDPDDKTTEVDENNPIYKIEKKELHISEKDIKKDFIDPYITEEQLYQSKKELEKIVTPVLKIKGQKSEMQQAFQDFRESGVFEIQNKKIDMYNGQITEKGMQELAAALEIYRNKNFETFRYFFVDTENGTIKDQYAISSHLPNRSTAGNNELLKKIITHFEDTNTKLVICHNHPSGNVQPSMEDMMLTQSLQNSVTNNNKDSHLLGHIILDHDSFAYYNAETKEWKKYTNENNKNKEDILLTRNENFPIKYSNSLRSTTQLAAVAEEINDTHNWNDKFVPVAFLDNDYRINGLQYYSLDYFNKDVTNLKRNFKQAALKNNSINAIPFITESLYNKIAQSKGQEALNEIEKKFKECIQKNVFLDVFVNSDSLDRKYGLDAGKSYKFKLKDTFEDSTFVPRIDNRFFASDSSVNENEPEYQNNSKTKNVKLSQESIDFYRNMAQSRKEQDTGIVNIIYRKDINDNTLYAIFPDHKFSKKDFWEYYSSTNENKAIDPNCLNERTCECNESEKKKIQKIVHDNILKGTRIKVNEYQTLDDVPSIKDKKIKELTNQVDFLKNQNKTFVNSLESHLSSEPETAKQILNLQLTNNLSKEQINTIITNALVQAETFRKENLNSHEIVNTSKKGRKA